MDTKIITAQVVPLNGREPDTPMAVFEKMKAIIKSCKTLEQIDNCRDLHTVYRLRFPEYSEFAYRLLYTHNAYHHRLLTDACYDALKSIRRYSTAEIAMEIDNYNLQSNNEDE